VPHLKILGKRGKTHYVPLHRVRTGSSMNTLKPLVMARMMPARCSGR
jgi:hypothetical protein